MRFQELFKHFGEMKHYFIAVVLVFAFSFYLGWAYSDSFSVFLNNQLSGIKKISESLTGKEHAQVWFFIVIFLNNALKAIIFIFLGLLFGILPLFMIVANGMILGFVLSLQTHEDTLTIIIKGILPHGIIEIPTILLACAYGLKLGVLVSKSALQALMPTSARTARTELMRVLTLTKPLSLLIVILLFVAAIIESTLTYWLVHL
ncbi:stage II sporulation protein M [Paenibacillus hexagrammi]|uniref:Stage II sporulation protein M n=1 Tax=Paenibacillus hexagrammi TaxID=2908839 RepID=A0ABY3SJQ0_9BACL|nr:stage II sporulation protein M [Paenibacillus sp. YPD9-1]UJF33718.1 stage II sporulation protein M [Paenibacillus sp. YPD9-1]